MYGCGLWTDSIVHFLPALRSHTLDWVLFTFSQPCVATLWTECCSLSPSLAQPHFFYNNSFNNCLIILIIWKIIKIIINIKYDLIIFEVDTCVSTRCSSQCSATRCSKYYHAVQQPVHCHAVQQTLPRGAAASTLPRGAANTATRCSSQCTATRCSKHCHAVQQTLPRGAAASALPRGAANSALPRGAAASAL